MKALLDSLSKLVVCECEDDDERAETSGVERDRMCGKHKEV